MFELPRFIYDRSHSEPGYPRVVYSRKVPGVPAKSTANGTGRSVLDAR